MGSKVKRHQMENDTIEGDKDIIAGTVPKDRLQANTISLIVPIQGIKDSTGLDATATGVKDSSGKFTIDTNGLKSAILRATWTASDTDSVTDIELYDETAAAVVGSVSGNTGSDTESSDLSGSITDGNLHSIRVNVTTASAATGATTGCTYAILELTYGYN